MLDHQAEGTPIGPAIPAPADGLVNIALTAEPPPANPPLAPESPDHGEPAAEIGHAPSPGVPPPPKPPLAADNAGDIRPVSCPPIAEGSD
ncbi:hypothetical protein MAHJHV34_49420 [Mycobacterium avium subsp. hominissuis]